MKEEQFKCWVGHFQITFDNGIMVSLFNGKGSYSDGRHSEEEGISNTVEVAVINTAVYRPWLTNECLVALGFRESDGDDDEVAADVKADQIPAIMNWAKNWNGDGTDG